MYSAHCSLRPHKVILCHCVLQYARTVGIMSNWVDSNTDIFEPCLPIVTMEGQMSNSRSSYESSPTFQARVEILYYDRCNGFVTRYSSVRRNTLVQRDICKT